MTVLLVVLVVAFVVGGVMTHTAAARSASTLRRMEKRQRKDNR